MLGTGEQLFVGDGIYRRRLALLCTNPLALRVAQTMTNDENASRVFKLETLLLA